MAVNPYTKPNAEGTQGQPSNRAVVISVNDPEKAGRVQLHIFGVTDDVPSEQCPWVSVAMPAVFNTNQSTAPIHGLLPGATVGVSGELNNWTVTHGLPNQRRDDQQSLSPAVHGKSETLSTVPHNDASKKWGFPYTINELVGKHWTKEQAMEFAGSKFGAGSKGRKSKRTEDPVQSAINKAFVDPAYGKRGAAKDPKGGSVGHFKFPGQNNPQEFIKNTIQNKSAVLEKGLSMIEELKKVSSNPTSIQSVGASNLFSVIQQLGSLFPSSSKAKRRKKKKEEMTEEEILEQQWEDSLEQQAASETV